MENLKLLAERYETAEFLQGDPSWFMHQVEGKLNQETMAFIASSLSYGSRKQFMPKIQSILNASNGDVYEWVKSGKYEEFIPNDASKTFYRLYSCQTMYLFLRALQDLFNEHSSLGEFVKSHAKDGYSTIAAICNFFSSRQIEGIIPKNTTSACKRICMFLRWMARDSSPVDLGLWSDFIDKRTLIIPLDTHVLQEAEALGLLNGKTASMSAAQKLTQKMSDIFADDPLKGDFALFGYGVNKS